MDFITDYRLEEYILNTEWEDMPADVRDRMISCSVDLMGALILGSQGGQYDSGVRVAKRIGAKGDIPVFADRERMNLLGASIAFSHAANSFDIDDGFNLTKGHPGASFAGGVLAASLEKNCSYREYLTTLAVCYETAIRWGLAEQDHYGFLHSTGAYGAFGTAAGVGRLHGLNREQLNNALSIADFHAPLSPVMRAVEYPSMNKDGVPFGSLMGVMAVIETEEGETGRTHLLELPEYVEHLDSLGEKYYVKDLYFKPYTCCRWAHQPIKAITDLMKDRGFGAHAIEKVTVHTFEAATRLNKDVPHTTDEAQYNIAYPVASAIINGDVGFEQIRDEALSDPDVMAMMDRLFFELDPDMEKEFPQKRLAWVEIKLSDGSIIRSSVYAAPGENDDPELSPKWILDKFRRVTAPVIDSDGQEKILAALGECSDIPMRDILFTVDGHIKKSR